MTFTSNICILVTKKGGIASKTHGTPPLIARRNKKHQNCDGTPSHPPRKRRYPPATRRRGAAAQRGRRYPPPPPPPPRRRPRTAARRRKWRRGADDGTPLRAAARRRYPPSCHNFVHNPVSGGMRGGYCAPPKLTLREGGYQFFCLY